MLRGYRLLCVAIAGLAALLVALGIGAYSATLHDAGYNRYQSYRYATDKPQEVDPAAVSKAGSQPLPYRTACKEPKGSAESELCAEWHSANAAEDSALWAERSFWVTGIGIVFLLWQVFLTRRAVAVAEDATKDAEGALGIAERNALSAERQVIIASDNAKKELRAYLCVTNFTIDGVCVGSVPKFVITVKNGGRTPAKNVKINKDCRIYARGCSITHIDIDFNQAVLNIGVTEPYNITVKLKDIIVDDVWNKLKKDILFMIIRFNIIYEDVSGDMQQTALCSQVSGYDNEMSIYPLGGLNIST